MKRRGSTSGGLGDHGQEFAFDPEKPREPQDRDVYGV